MTIDGDIMQADAVPPETILVQKQIHWRIHTHFPTEIFSTCAECPRHLATQPFNANTAPFYNSIWDRYYNKKWTLLIGTVRNFISVSTPIAYHSIFLVGGCGAPFSMRP
jgi:hypothetical protein